MINSFAQLQETVKNKKIVRIYSYVFSPEKSDSPLQDYGRNEVATILLLTNKYPNQIHITSHNKTKAGETFNINLSFGEIKTKSIVGNGTIIKLSGFVVFYEETGIVNSLEYNNNELMKIDEILSSKIEKILK